MLPCLLRRAAAARCSKESNAVTEPVHISARTRFASAPTADEPILGEEIETKPETALADAPQPQAEETVESRPSGLGEFFARFVHHSRRAFGHEALSVAERIARDFGNLGDRSDDAASGCAPGPPASA
jgi:hypothetical protein